MNTFIEELTSTYDTNLFDNQSELLQKKFLDYSIMNKENKGNKILMELICNHYDKSVNKPIAEFIGGPKNLTIHWHPGYNKIIYIFGEWHSNTMDCTDFDEKSVTFAVEDYLYDLMLSTDVFLDIFCETSFPDEELSTYVSYAPADTRLHKLINNFTTCLYKPTRHDKICKLARSHYFDFRLPSSNPGNLESSKIDIVWVMSRLQRCHTISAKGGKGIEIFKRFMEKEKKMGIILKNLAHENDEIVFEFMKDQLRNNRYIKKELSKIVENKKLLKSAIVNFCEILIYKNMKPKFNKIRSLVLQILDLEKNLDEDKKKELLTSIGTLWGLMVYPLACFVDAYLLARVFKDFDMTEIDKKAYEGATHQPNRAHNIIIYAGEYHAENYRDFLSIVGFDEIDSSGIEVDDTPSKPKQNIPKNCLDMRNIKQPFFSYKRYDPSSFQVLKKNKRPKAVIPYK
jgi:hypothetical protein